MGKVLGSAKTTGEDVKGGERLLQLLGGVGQEGRVHYPGCHRHTTHPDAGEITCQWQCHADDPTLRRRVGSLPDLALEGRVREATLTITPRSPSRPGSF